MLHHLRTLILIQYQRPFFCQKTPNNKGFPAIRPFQTEVPVAGFFYLHPIATRVFLHDSFWCRVNLHDCSRETCIFTRFSRVLCKNTRFISTVITPSLYGAYHVAYVNSIPTKNNELRESEGIIREKSKECVLLAKIDWDSFETSWDFEQHPLIVDRREYRDQMELNCNAEARRASVSLISKRFEIWMAACEDRFNHLKANEEGKWQ